jgi:hypothetical protein
VPEDVPSLQRSSSFYYPEERTVAMETFESLLMRRIAQMTPDDSTMICVVIVMFVFTEITVILLSVFAWII